MGKLDKDQTDSLQEDLRHARQALRDANHAFDVTRSKLAAAVQCPPDATWVVITATVEAMGKEMTKAAQQLSFLEATLRLIVQVANLPLSNKGQTQASHHDLSADVPTKKE